jgi:cytochrome oxidase assembly protein ShyY1
VRFLLRPSWLGLIVAVVGFAVACYALLAPWQFGREAQRDAEQQAIDASYTLPPAPLAELAPAGVTSDVEWRQVGVSGTYVPEGEAVVRLRVVTGRPAVEVLTPFRTDDGRLVVVDRGTVEAESGSVVPPIPPAPAGPVTLTARLRVDETDPRSRPPFEDGGHLQMYAADSRALAAATGLAFQPGFLLLSAGQPGVLTPIEVTPTSGGSAPFTNFSYALQWLTFGAIALFALVYFVRLELLQRRKGAGRATERAAIRRALAGEEKPGETPLSERYGKR